MGGTTSKCALIERGRYAVESIYHIGGPDAGFPDPRQRHRHPRSRRRRRLDRLARRAAPAQRRPAQRRLDAGARLLRPRRHGADRDRRQPAARAARCRLFPRRRDDARHREGARSRARAASPIRSAIRAAQRRPRAAKGVLTIANLTMSSIIKKVSIARGYDPRDFALFCYGGGGPLHGIELARALKIPRVVVPPEPGNFSALGMLLADPRLDTAQTFVVRLDAGEPRRRARPVTPTSKPKAGAALRREFGDGHDQRSSARPRCATRASSIRSRSRFRQGRCGAPARHASIRNTCGATATPTSRPKSQIVVLHSLATLAHEAPGHRPPRQPPASRRAMPNMAARPIFFLEEDRFLSNARSMTAMRSAQGFAATGPALIVEYGSSTLIGPRDTFRIGKLGEIDIDCSALMPPTLRRRSTHRSGHRGGDPAPPRRHLRRGRRQHHPHGVQPLHLRIQGLCGRHRRSRAAT